MIEVSCQHVEIITSLGVQQWIGFQVIRIGLYKSRNAVNITHKSLYSGQKGECSTVKGLYRVISYGAVPPDQINHCISEMNHFLINNLFYKSNSLTHNGLENIVKQNGNNRKPF